MKTEKSGIVYFESESSNPIRARLLMIKLIEATDQSLKKKFITQGNQALLFYHEKILKARSKEHKVALAKLIAAEEQKLMFASRDAAFVAEILSGPKVSLYPTKPNPSKLIAMSIILGFVASCMLILIRANLFKEK